MIKQNYKRKISLNYKKINHHKYKLNLRIRLLKALGNNKKTYYYLKKLSTKDISFINKLCIYLHKNNYDNSFIWVYLYRYYRNKKVLRKSLKNTIALINITKKINNFNNDYFFNRIIRERLKNISINKKEDKQIKKLINYFRVYNFNNINEPDCFNSFESLNKTLKEIKQIEKVRY